MSYIVVYWNRNSWCEQLYSNGNLNISILVKELINTSLCCIDNLLVLLLLASNIRSCWHITRWIKGKRKSPHTSYGMGTWMLGDTKFPEKECTVGDYKDGSSKSLDSIYRCYSEYECNVLCSTILFELQRWWPESVWM